MTPYLMPREDWSAELKSRGCEFVQDAGELETCAEV